MGKNRVLVLCRHSCGEWQQYGRVWLNAPTIILNMNAMARATRKGMRVNHSFADKIISVVQVSEMFVAAVFDIEP